jgi:hypothetical protein
VFSNEHCEKHSSGAKALVDSAGSFVGVKTPTYQLYTGVETPDSLRRSVRSAGRR